MTPPHIARQKAVREKVAAQGTLTPADLREIANGGIMEAGAIYLPAGKCSDAEVARREGLRSEG